MGDSSIYLLILLNSFHWRTLEVLVFVSGVTAYLGFRGYLVNTSHAVAPSVVEF